MRKKNPVVREQTYREENNVRHDTVSLRRRHLIIAGLVGIAMPAGVFAAQSAGTRRGALAAESADGSGLVVSGRILGYDGKPLADATVEAWQPGEAGSCLRASTDADGRFVLTSNTCAEHGGRPQALSYRVRHPGQRALESKLDFAHAQLQRDDTGTWRTAVGLTLA